MNCGLTIVERDRLRRTLRELPDTMPPRAVWQRIEQQARAEGLLRRPAIPERVRWAAGAGIAFLARLLVPGLPVIAKVHYMLPADYEFDVDDGPLLNIKGLEGCETYMQY